MIQLTNVLCALLRYNGTNNIWLQYVADSIIRDPIKRRALYVNLKLLMSKKILVSWTLLETWLSLQSNYFMSLRSFQTYNCPNTPYLTS